MTDEPRKQDAAVKSALERFAQARRLLLEVELPDHTVAALPVRFAVGTPVVLVLVRGDQRAMQRLEEGPAVRIASCTRRGRPLDEPLQCRARVLRNVEEATAKAAIENAYGFWWRMRSRMPFGDTAYVELIPFTRPKPVGGGDAPERAEPKPPDPAPESDDDNSHDDDPGAA